MLNAKLYKYRIPLISPLWVGMQQISTRIGLVLELISEKEPIYVEISPLSGFDIDNKPLLWEPQTTIDDVVTWFNLNFDEYYKDKITPNIPCIAFALSLMDYEKCYRSEQKKIPFISLQDIDNLKIKIADTFSVKMKVGRDIKKEIIFIYKMLAINPNLNLRLDANRSFNLDDAISFFGSIPLSNIYYVEEPCTSIEQNIELFNRLGINFALDESIDANFEFIPHPGLKALVIKPMGYGSIDRLKQLIKISSEYGVNVILSSSYEASLGIKALSDIAADLTCEPAGVDTLDNFSHDLIYKTSNKPLLTINDLEVIWSYK